MPDDEVGYMEVEECVVFITRVIQCLRAESFCEG